MMASPPVFEIKSASLDVLAVLLYSVDIPTVERALQERFKTAPTTQLHDAFLLDLEAIEQLSLLDYGALFALFQHYGMHIIGLRHSDLAMAEIAQRYGILYDCATARNHTEVSAVSLDEAKHHENVPANDGETGALIIERPVRAGQQIYAKGRDLVILSMVSAGAEVIADGSIHVYAPLRGRALAGARGAAGSRIFTRAMDAELVSIAGVYRPIDQALPNSIAGKPTQIYLENQRLVMKALSE